MHIILHISGISQPRVEEQRFADKSHYVDL